jgi:GAF domain-containing protein
MLAAALARSADLLIPAITTALAVPQLAAARRPQALALAVGMGALLAADALGNRDVVRLAHQTGLTVLFQSAGFTAILWAALGADGRRLGGKGGESAAAQPPFLVPGLVGIGALAVSAGAIVSGSALAVLFAAILALSLGGRELLRSAVQRRTDRQLTASLELETRLLDLQGDTTPNLPAQEALRRSCSLAAEVLNADCALAWIVGPAALILQAVGPAETPASFVGRRVPLDQPHSLLVRAFRSRAPEAWDAETVADPVDRSIVTALDAGWILAAPIMRQNTVIGVLEVIRRPGRSPFDSFAEQQAALIGAQVASTLHRIELYDDLEYQLRESTLVHRFAVQAVTARTTNDVAWYLLESMRARFPFDRASVYLNETTPWSSLKAIANFHARVPERDSPPSEDARHLSIALRCGDALIGHVQLQRSGSADAFTEDETRVAQTLAQQAGFAIQRLRLEEESGKVSVYREMNRLMTDLLNAVSHDLRGPLANIKAYAATLMNEEMELSVPEQREYLETIEEEADRLKDLLDHLLDLSKIEAGMLTSTSSPWGSTACFGTLSPLTAGSRTATRPACRQTSTCSATLDGSGRSFTISSITRSSIRQTAASFSSPLERTTAKW